MSFGEVQNCITVIELKESMHDDEVIGGGESVDSAKAFKENNIDKIFHEAGCNRNQKYS